MGSRHWHCADVPVAVLCARVAHVSHFDDVAPFSRTSARSVGFPGWTLLYSGVLLEQCLRKSLAHKQVCWRAARCPAVPVGASHCQSQSPSAPSLTFGQS